MVLRPNYHSGEQQPNMQYPPTGPPRDHQGGQANQYAEQEYRPVVGTAHPDGMYYPSPRDSAAYYGDAQQSRAYAQPMYGQPYGYYPPPAQRSSGYMPQYSSTPSQQPLSQYEQPGPQEYGRNGPAPYGLPPASPGGIPGNSSMEVGSRPNGLPALGEGQRSGNAPDVGSELPASAMSPQSEGERGLMGALAGGMAGGYAGHKIHHGLLGAFGGAYAGHKLEDAYKEHQKHSRPSSPAPPITPDSHPNQHLESQHQSGRIGNFSHSSKNMSLDSDYDLIASSKDVRGNEKLTSISLNHILTNENGSFRWMDPGSSSGNFGGSARNVRLIEGGSVLEAELCCINGSWQWDQIHLDERITNNDGNLELV